MKKTKKRQFQHTQKRAKYRYGLTIGPKTYDCLCKKIQEQQDSVFLYKKSNRVTLYAVFMEDQWIPVIYDKERHSVVTFLPPEALEPYRTKLNAKAAKLSKIA